MSEPARIPEDRVPSGSDSAAAAVSPAAGPGPAPSELLLIEALRRGDERAFETLVSQYHAGLLRLAMIYVSSRAVAEEVVQETWLGVIQGLERFESRCSLKTWIFRILLNRARTRAEREGRSLTFSALWDPDRDPGESAVPPERFRGPDQQWPGHWASPPQSWAQSPEQLLLSQETREYIQRAIEALPPAQREVITLRDIEQWTCEEVCNVLGIRETNQRVLLHRARSKVRAALETYFGRPRSA